MKRGAPLWAVAVFVVAVTVAGLIALATLGSGSGSARDDAARETDTQRAGGDGAAAEDWSDLVAQAQGQTVRLWMWGGEPALNAYIDQTVASAAAAQGVTLERVPIDDTASALSRLVAEADAGVDDGAIDLLWVNGKNFEQGRAAGLWREDWVPELPNAALLPVDDDTLWTDFGVPTDGQEMPWSRAAFVFAHDQARLEQPPMSFEELLAYARAHPGRVAYPAPPDFTGSAFVRQAVQALGERAAFEYLAELDRYLWRSGETYPLDQAELDQLFANGEIDLAMSYNPNFVDVAVERGAFADSVRPYVFDGGTLQNVSFLAIPARAAHPQGAMVVANLLLSPELQQAKLDQVGMPSVLPEAALDDVDGEVSPHRLGGFGVPLSELPAAQVPAIDERWMEEIA